MGPRRELQRVTQWSPSRRGKNGYRLLLMPRVGSQCNLTDAGQKCINLSLALAQVHRAGSVAGFSLYWKSFKLLTAQWEDYYRNLGERLGGDCPKDRNNARESEP